MENAILTIVLSGMELFL